MEPAPPVRAVRRAALSDAILRRKAGARRIIRDVYSDVLLVALFYCSGNILGGLLFGLPSFSGGTFGVLPHLNAFGGLPRPLPPHDPFFTDT